MAKNKPLLALLISVLTTAAALLLIFTFDNKYTHPARQPLDGVLVLDEQELEEQPLRFLTNDWLCYPGVLLSPQQLAAGDKLPPPLTVTVGVGEGASIPYGMDSASFTMTLELPQERAQYAIELPEIYSAYRFYINDKQVVQQGNPDHDSYRDSLQSRVMVFSATGTTQLLLAVTDHSSTYGGITYPPAFGLPQAVQAVRDTRLLTHTALVLVAVFAGLLSLYLTVRVHQHEGWLLMLCCFCLVGMTIYPLLHGLWATTYQPWYPLEMACHYLLLLLAVLLQHKLYALRGVTVYLGLVPAAAGLLLSLCYGFGAAMLTVEMVRVCSMLFSIIKYYVAGYLILLSFMAALAKRQHSLLLLMASASLGVCLLFDRFLNNYEPIYGGWFSELGSGLLVAAFAVSIWSQFGEAYRNRLMLDIQRKQLEQQQAARRSHADLQQNYLHSTRRLLHESRSQLAVLRHYAQQQQWQQQLEYIDSLLQNDDLPNALQYSGNELVDAILSIELQRAKDSGIYFELGLLQLKKAMQVSDNDMASVLMNLLDNAIEGCCRLTDCDERWIFLEIVQDDSSLTLRCHNSAPVATVAAHHTSKEDKVAHGHGTAIINEIATRYNGSFTLLSQEDSYQACAVLQLHE